MGRNTIFTDELATTICTRIASGESLRSICKDDSMPAISSVMLWLVDGKHEAFSEQYANARRIQAEVLADELFDISDDGSNDWMERNDKDGEPGYVINGEHVQRSRLRLDTRKWYLSKVLPKFADKQQIDHTTKGEKLESKPVDLSGLTDEQLAIMAQLAKGNSTGDK